MSESIPLYRFLSAEAAIKTIEMRAFRVSRLVELNDPFEWLPGFDETENLPPGGVELAIAFHIDIGSISDRLWA